MLSSIYGVDFGSGQAIPGKDTDHYADELTKYMLSKVKPLSLGVTQEEKEQQPSQGGAADVANRIGAFLGSTPSVAPKGWQQGYEDAERVKKEQALQHQKAREATNGMSKLDVMQMQINKNFTAKERMEIAQGKDPSYNMRKVFKLINQETQKQKQEEEENQLVPTSQTGA